MLKASVKRIMVVSHEASYTGAPLLLIELMKFLQTNSAVEFRIVIVRGGKLEDEFRKLGAVEVLKPVGYSDTKGGARLMAILRNRTTILKVFLKALTCDLVFSNSIINGKILSWLRYTGKPMVTYVHELDKVVAEHLHLGNVGGSLKYSSCIIYPCEKVKETLIRVCQVPHSKLQRLNYYFPSDSFKSSEHSTGKSLSFCGVGTANNRKGTDLFIEVAHQVKVVNPDYHFTWIGAFEDKASEERYRSAAKDDQGNTVVEFSGPFTHEETKNQYQMFDAILLTSREDPYPLVVLESAYAKRPSIVFREAGGISEFVDQAGWILNDISSTEMAECILKLNKEDLKKKGEVAYAKVLKLHSDKQLLAEQLNHIFSSL